jgi:hypothetical protein
MSEIVARLPVELGRNVRRVVYDGLLKTQEENFAKTVHDGFYVSRAGTKLKHFFASVITREDAETHLRLLERIHTEHPGEDVEDPGGMVWMTISVWSVRERNGAFDVSRIQFAPGDYSAYGAAIARTAGVPGKCHYRLMRKRTVEPAVEPAVDTVKTAVKYVHVTRDQLANEISMFLSGVM